MCACVGGEVLGTGINSLSVYEDGWGCGVCVWCVCMLFAVIRWSLGGWRGEGVAQGLPRLLLVSALFCIVVVVVRCVPCRAVVGGR